MIDAYLTASFKGNNCTIAWYYYDNKVLHIDEEVNTKIIETIAEHFGELTVIRGRKQKLLVINIEFLRNRKLSLFMKDYIEESITLFNKDIYATVYSPEKKVYRI